MTLRSPADPVSPRTVLAVDPGSVKCGWAVVTQDAPGAAARRLGGGVVPTERLTLEIARVVAGTPAITTIVMGDGTQSATLRKAVAAAFPGLKLVVVDERGSSQRARERWSRERGARGWQRILPPGLRVPSAPYDDLVAELLAEEFLRNP